MNIIISRAQRQLAVYISSYKFEWLRLDYLLF